MSQEMVSRYVLAFGQTTITKFQKLKILVQGLSGLGCEISKNIIMLSPSILTIIDDKLVQNSDLANNFFLKEDSIGKKRSQEILTNLQKLNPDVKITTQSDSDLNNNLIKQYDLIILTEFWDDAQILSFNAFCREQKKPIGFIHCGILGLFLFSFVDFGNGFKIYDKDGLDSKTYLIKHISKSNPGVITILKDKKHEFETGDFVRIYDVEGMTEVNGTDTRPIKIIDEYSFIIEDTSEFTNYQGGGFVEQAKVPFRVNFKNYQESRQIPFSKENKYLQMHYGLQSIMKFYIAQKRLPNIKSQADYEQILQIWNQLEQPQENILKNISYYSKTIISPLCSILGSIIVFESIKYTGKYMPLKEFFYMNFFDCLPEVQIQELIDPKERYHDYLQIFGSAIQKKIQQLNVAQFGMGYLGCEFLKNCALIGMSTAQNSSYALIDDSKVCSNSHFFFKKNFIGEYKNKAAESYIKNISQQMNIVNVSVRPLYENENEFIQILKNCDLVISSVNHKQKCDQYITQKTTFYKKSVIGGCINQMEGIGGIYVPGQTDSMLNKFKIYENTFDFEQINYYPNIPQHNVIWAKKLFQQLFINLAVDINNQINDIYDQISTKIVYAFFVQNLQISFENLIILGLELYIYFFVKQIQDQIDKYSKNLEIDGQKFWKGYKKFPSTIELDFTDLYFNQFVVSIANIFSFMFNTTITSQERGDLIYILKKNIIKIEKQEFVFQFNFSLLESQTNNMFKEIKSKNLQKFHVPKLFGHNTEHTNIFIDFICSASNLRSRCYHIQELQRHNVEKIIFNYDQNAFILFTLISGFTIMQIYKLYSGKNNFKGINANFLNKDFIIFDIPKPENLQQNSIIYEPESQNIWTQIPIQGPMPIQDILQSLTKDLSDFEITDLQIENKVIINKQYNINLFLDDESKIKLNPEILFQKLTDIEISKYKNELEMILIGLNSQTKQVIKFANIYYNWK